MAVRDPKAFWPGGKQFKGMGAVDGDGVVRPETIVVPDDAVTEVEAPVRPSCVIVASALVEKLIWSDGVVTRKVMPDG